MSEKNSLSTNNLQKNFQKWFGNSVPPDLPVPDEANHSINDPVPVNLPFSAEADYSINNPVPVKKSFSVEADHSSHGTRRKFTDNLQKISALFKFGCIGAITLGTIASFIILIIYFSNYRVYMYDWLNQIFVILFLVAVIGFLGGMYIGSVYKDDLGVA